jgi:Arylsulfotransferase (ASST)
MTQRVVAKALLAAGALVAGSGAAMLGLISRPIVAHAAAPRARAAPRCVPPVLNRSALLGGTGLAVSPLPGSLDASPHTQISLLGAPAAAISDVIVRGSKTGAHRGRLRGYSQGDGASFLPARPFRSGETVTVRGKLRLGSHRQRFAFSFVVASEDNLIPTPLARRASSTGANQDFRSRPDLLPPIIAVTMRSGESAPGYLFAAPYNGPGPSGPMIFDEAGNLVWFHPLPAGIYATNLQVQQYYGKPVLTWWQGSITSQGTGAGEEVIDNASYQQIGSVHADNGYKADLHDFHITSQNTADIPVLNAIACNLSAVGGRPAGAVIDSIIQEIDLKTGLVRREWHSLDHVGQSSSYSSPLPGSKQLPFDYFHINSIDPQADGRTLVSGRNTWTLYELSTRTGQVVSQIGGKHSTVKLAPGAATAFQHDATALPNGMISIFDNGAVPKIHPQSRGILVAINPQTDTETLLAQFEHPTPLSSASQGDIQVLANGNLFIGWGAEPYFSEFGPEGQLLFDAHMTPYNSYRVYRFPWTGTPTHPPAVAATSPASSSSGAAPLTVYASWNGDTRTASWRVFAGPSPQQLAPVASAPREGFQTAITTPGPQAYVAVQALDRSGAVLATSATIKG